MTHENALVRGTADAYFGPENPSYEEWSRWHRAMLQERSDVLSRAQFDPAFSAVGDREARYDDDASAWSDTAFRQMFLFMYDASFFDAEKSGAEGYRTTALVDRWTRLFGRIDEVLLWHAYPRLGFDTRTQFDFYRQMPGGLEGLRAGVSDVLHARGIRVLVDYNPWDAGTYEELAAIVHALDADGVMLDTMTDVPAELREAVSRKKRGVLFAPELRPKTEDLRHTRRAWAQWCDVGDERAPSIYRNRWLVPWHRQLAIARWDTSRKKDIVYSFFNGSGLVLWDNIFGSMNPYSREDRRLIAETAAVFDHYQDLFAQGNWLPLIPTGVVGLDANCFVDGVTGRAITTFRNRTDARLSYTLTPLSTPPAGSALTHFALWGDKHAIFPGESVFIEPNGTQAIVRDTPEHASQARGHFEALSRRADIEMPEDLDPHPRPRLQAPPAYTFTSAAPPSPRPATMISLPGGTFDLRIVHERRECGCYPDGVQEETNAMWGWHYKDVLEHNLSVIINPFAIRITAVTNAEYLSFVHAAQYRPKDDTRFLAHIARLPDGSLPSSLPLEQGLLPVTHVSLADARAFAAFHGQRLPTEAEWQWAAEGAGRGTRFPWGDAPRVFSGDLRSAHDETSATPQGVMGLSGNAWELTESEHTDGNTRFVMLRGGVFLPPGKSEWLVERGVRSNDSHAKYLLLADCLDRSDAISFRTVSSTS